MLIVVDSVDMLNKFHNLNNLTILKNLLQAALFYMIIHNDHWLSSSKKGKAP